MKFILLIIVSVYLDASMLKSINTIYDDENKLTWQNTKDNITISKTHKNAIKYCEDLKLLGANNWRLPTRQEYKLIINIKRDDEHMINKAFNHNLPSDYWTSETTWRNFGKYAYYVFFKSGAIYYNNKNDKKFVRCIR